MRSFSHRDSELATLNRPVKKRLCDCPGCGQAGEFRAPRNHELLTEYYWFCLDHVRAYNEQWDYLAGLSPEEIEQHIRHATVWERPTWPLGRAKAQAFHSEKNTRNTKEYVLPPGAREAFAVLELEPPTNMTAIKNQYRRLVKKHHPDANGGNSEAEEKFKQLNQAFTTLRGFYAKSKT